MAEFVYSLIAITPELVALGQVVIVGSTTVATVVGTAIAATRLAQFEDGCQAEPRP